MYTKKIRSYLMYGANRNPSIRYPNRETGYGDFDLLGTFNVISRTFRGRKIGGHRINNSHIKNTKKDYV